MDPKISRLLFNKKKLKKINSHYIRSNEILATIQFITHCLLVASIIMLSVLLCGYETWSVSQGEYLY
jgi:hypothetical protein